MADDTPHSIVVNTSPWISLSICGQINLLERMYKNIYMPVQVREEIMAGGIGSFGVKEFKTSPWLKISKVHDKEKLELLYELDKGEAEVIILAKEQNIKKVLIDEKIARQQARILGLEVIGTLGLLLKAKNKGLISSIKPSIKKILDNGVWINDEIVKGILKEAGE